MREPFVEPKGVMADSASHLGEPAALQAIMAKQGYVYLRGAVPAEAIDWVRGEMIAVAAEEGLLDTQALAKHARGEVDTTWTGHCLPGVGIPGRQAQAAFKRRRIWETFVEMPGIRERFEAVIGGPVRFLPISEYRTAAPQSRTPIHQDGAANYGYDVHTAWFPVMQIDAELGGLAVLPWLPGKAYPPLQETGLSPAETATDPGWVRADYEPGDMVVFEGSTQHCGLVNHSADRLRLSVEIRFHGPSAPRPLLGHIVRIDADAITVTTEEGEEVTLGLDDNTRMRGDRFTSHELIRRTELAGTDLVAGFPVIVGQADGWATSVRGIF